MFAVMPIKSMRIVFLRCMMRELQVRGFSNHRIAEAASVPTEQLLRLMEFGSRPDPIYEQRLLNFGADVLLERAKTDGPKLGGPLPGAPRPVTLARVSIAGPAP
jgi:hypothetical protein